MDQRGRELPGEGLRPVRGRVDHTRRAAGAPARAGRRGPARSRAARSRDTRARGRGPGGRGRGARPGGRGPEQASDGVPLWYAWGGGPGVLADGTDRHAPRRAEPACGAAEAGAAVSAVARRALLAAVGPVHAGGRRGRRRWKASWRATSRRAAAARRSAAVRTLRMTGRARRRQRTGRGRHARDRAPRPYPHGVRVPGNAGRLRLGRLRRLARVPTRRQLCTRAAGTRAGRRGRRASRHRRPARGLEGEGPRGRARRDARRSPAARRTGSEADAEVGCGVSSGLGRRGDRAGRSNAVRDADAARARGRSSRRISPTTARASGVRFARLIEAGVPGRPRPGCASSVRRASRRTSPWTRPVPGGELKR